ncbi:hypothetical protein [Dickeya sp. NCPPB 3274]|uniref:hypothetical protein n=1 Tax=Dickeya sp. NCPPB 3274 TaxID=568766 RepID=UPI0005B313CB|nr:hypothetical protein [Dickeya sp. NCPPB 3274]
MYPIFIKDRGNTVFIFLDYLNDVSAVKRKEAAYLLAELAFSYGYRSTKNTVYGNTLMAWGKKKHPLPFWAMRTMWTFLANSGYTPDSEKGWAWWAYTYGGDYPLTGEYRVSGPDWLREANTYRCFLSEFKGKDVYGKILTLMKTYQRDFNINDLCKILKIKKEPVVESLSKMVLNNVVLVNQDNSFLYRQ